MKPSIKPSIKHLILAAALCAAATAGARELTMTGPSATYDTLWGRENTAVTVATDVAVSFDDPTDLVTYIDERIAAAMTPDAATHTRYFGWSADRTIEAADFTAATTSTSTSDTGAWPATASAAYPWFAEPESVGYPTGLYRGANPINQIVFFDRQTGTVTVSGAAYVVGVSQNRLTASTDTRPVRLEH